MECIKRISRDSRPYDGLVRAGSENFAHIKCVCDKKYLSWYCLLRKNKINKND